MNIRKIVSTAIFAAAFSLANFAREARNCPIIDFGDDYCWHGGTQGLPTYRGGESVIQLFKASSAGDCPVDVDGDGSTENDSLAYYEFSLEKPFNPNGPFYNIKGNNAVFYGGAVSFWANRRPNWAEGGINIDHELRDDFNLHSYATEGGNVGLRTFGIWLWKKDNFLNGGVKYPVSFDKDSKIAVYVSRYWKDYEEGRFVVQDGEKFYISEFSFGGKTHTLYELKPLESAWAEYEPKAPFFIEFKAESAKFAKRNFTDIRAVGWYVAKPTLGRASLWLKWYAFGVDAVIIRPEMDSYLLKMKKLPGGGAITEQPLSYAEWRKIYKWSNRNQYGMNEPYVYDRDGDMGKMFLHDKPYSAEEPVTDITIHDAVAWCNALSEYEGLEPCFYTDPQFNNPLRQVMDRTLRKKWDERTQIYVKWSADGFRPATKSERNNAEGFFVVRTRGKEPGDVKFAIEQWRKDFVPQDLSSVSGKPDIKLIAINGGTYSRNDGAEVKIKPFYLAETETTFAQWKKVYAWAASNGYEFDRDGDLGSMDWSEEGSVFSQDEPVTQVSHNDVMLWCNALSEMEGRMPVYYVDPEMQQIYRRAHRFRIENTIGREAHYKVPDKGEQKVYIRWDCDGYRIPTLWEWDYAYRAGDKRREGYPWKEGEINEYAWFGENSADKTHPVKTKKANAFGLYDMAGNVFEWTLGGGESYYLNDNPRGEGKPVPIGGSFRTAGGEIGLMFRFGGRVRVAIKSSLATAYPEIGFRVARYDKGVHPVEAPPYIPEKVLDFDTKRHDAN